MELSEQQKEAVEHLGSPTLVVAGAGSGKTRTLTAKIAYMIEKGYDPERLLAITFTNKAAEEMKDRLVKQTGLPASKFPWVRTFHSACYKILRMHCTRLGYHNPIQIYDTSKQQKIIKDIVVGKLNFEKKHVYPVLSKISAAKNSGDPLKFIDGKPKYNGIRLGEVYQLYEKALREINAVDFDNILLMTRNLLRDHDDIREKYRSFFQYILCDEYQDTNNLQEELTSLLVRDGRLFCVGDDWQAIYSFRGSNVNHFLSFRKKYDNAKIFRLEQNYRSSDEIVRVANDLIEYNPDRMEKKCYSSKDGGLIEMHEFFSDEEEADWVARKAMISKRPGNAVQQDGRAVSHQVLLARIRAVLSDEEAPLPTGRRKGVLRPQGNPGPERLYHLRRVSPGRRLFRTGDQHAQKRGGARDPEKALPI